MARFEEVQEELRQNPRRWLVTGVAGFIGSGLLEHLLKLGQEVVGIDNFSAGKPENLEDVQAIVGREAWSRFTFIEADILDRNRCREACHGTQVVLHQAALGSVPRSIKLPEAFHSANVDGFVNMLIAARDAGVDAFVYASSSSVYGDSQGLPKVEESIGNPLSPYALTKSINEQYANLFARVYGFQGVGLRYFNVFGPRQDPNGAYAAVIPKWIAQMREGRTCEIYGDGETSRDFCYVKNVAQANLLAALAPTPARGRVYNVACCQSTTLNQLFLALREGLGPCVPGLANQSPIYLEGREGDIRHSLADLSSITARLGYQPTHAFAQGIAETLTWVTGSR
jgi:UDP-N-acetylglucosamine 4-epimerase